LLRTWKVGKKEMREILFRGKEKDSGKWVYGYYRQKNVIGGTAHLIYKRGVPADVYGTAIRVDPETVGQYTGLKSSKGVEIFEGDILCVRLDDDTIRAYEVQYYNGSFVCCRRKTICRNRGIMQILDNYISENSTVVDNVYDNPDFLWRFE